MARKPPQAPPPPWQPPKPAPTVMVTLKTMTPMFGGGYKTRSIAETGPIRAAAVRGHLRYWWRASVGAALPDSKTLFEREESLWGSTKKPGRATVRVENLDSGTECKPSQFAPRHAATTGPQEAYFLFPFQEQKKEGTPEARGREGVTFRLTITLNVPAEERPAAMGEIVRALSVWLMFGGVGSRTRRGLGSLELVECRPEQRPFLLPPASGVELAKWLEQRAHPFSRKRPWTVLGGFYVLGEPTTALGAWRELGIFWSRFRKGHDAEASPMEGSLWPDHETLRTLPPAAGSAALGKPALGLPIIYQRFEAKGRIPASFSGTLENTGEKATRLASPIILKPVFCADGKVRPLVALLSAPGPREVRIKETGQVLALRPLPHAVPLSKVSDPCLAAIERAAVHFTTKMRRLRAEPEAAQ